MRELLRSALALLLLAGCVGDPAIDGRSSDLEETDPPVPEADWRDAPACEGPVPDDATVEPVEGEPGLRAVVGPDGDIVCVDSSAVLEEDSEAEGGEEAEPDESEEEAAATANETRPEGGADLDGSGHEVRDSVDKPDGSEGSPGARPGGPSGVPIVPVPVDPGGGHIAGGDPAPEPV